ncbi:hypothetical protein [Streptomyces sp. AC555_RSS877]|nr:hypothetical protein [Streptomyces sp. AC555_RSS877]
MRGGHVRDGLGRPLASVADGEISEIGEIGEAALELLGLLR